MVDPAKKEFPALTGIRFVAASLVFVFHYAQVLYTNKPPDFWYYLMRQCNVGVNLFFVLSGFLITHRYVAGTFTRAAFWLYWYKRIARIIPLYYAVLLMQVFFFCWQQHRPPDAMTLFLNITLLKGLSDVYLYTLLTQSWSLTVEEMFYLFAPFCFYLLRRKVGIFFQFPVLVASGFLLVGLARLLQSASFFGGVPFLFAFTFFGRCFEFFAGMYVALLVRNGIKNRASCWLTTAGGLSSCLLIGLLAVYAWRGSIAVINDHLVGVLLFNVLIPASFALLFYGLIAENSWLKSLLATKPLLLLGKSSYAFYLLHIGALAEVIFFQLTANVFLLYLLLQAASIAAYNLFEKPVYFWLLRLFAKRIKAILR